MNTIYRAVLSHQQILRGSSALLVATILFTSPVAAQQPDSGLSLLGETLLSVLFTLVVGGGLIIGAPDFTTRTTDRIREQPGVTLIYGILCSIVLLIVLVILMLSGIGILLAIPLIIILGVIAQIGFLAAGRAVSLEWPIALLVALLLTGFTAVIPLLGTLVGFILGSMGLGVVYLDYTSDGSSRRRSIWDTSHQAKRKK